MGKENAQIKGSYGQGGGGGLSSAKAQ